MTGGELGHDAGHRAGGSLAGLVHPGGVDLEGGGAAAAVTESARDGADVHAGGDQFGGGVSVAE